MEIASNDTQKKNEKNKKKRFDRKEQMSLSRRKTLRMPENTGFLGDVVADWLQKCVINLLSE